MNVMKMRWRWLAVCLFMLAACEEEESSPLVILATPEQESAKVVGGDKVLYTIEAFANSGELEYVKFTSKDACRGTVMLLDSTVATQRLKMDFVYTVPRLDADSVAITLRFEAGNMEQSSTTTHVLNFVGGGMYIEEESGYVMYSAASSKANAFLWTASRVTFAELEADSLTDIYDYHAPEVRADSLMREWRSRTGICFVRYNDFNYPQATVSSIRQAYEAGVKYNALKAIRPDDIVLLGSEERGVLGVIRIVQVFDEAGTENDRYVFNLKKAIK